MAIFNGKMAKAMRRNGKSIKIYGMKKKLINFLI